LRISAAWPVAGDGLRRGSSELAQLPTGVKEVLTLLVKSVKPLPLGYTTLLGNSRRALANVIRLRVAGGLSAISLACRRRLQDRFTARFCLPQQRHSIPSPRTAQAGSAFDASCQCNKSYRHPSRWPRVVRRSTTVMPSAGVAWSTMVTSPGRSGSACRG
jgi:hypothetical protein